MSQVLSFACLLTLPLGFALAESSVGEQVASRANDAMENQEAVSDDEDETMSESGYHGDQGRPSKETKFFMYAHQPDKKQYEFGFKRGSDKHTIERYEKAGPNHNFKAKVRWHDANGGHGEHFWDYNHVPGHNSHKDGEGGGYGHSGGGYHSEPVPDYMEADSAGKTVLLDDKAFMPGAHNLNSEKILRRAGLQKLNITDPLSNSSEDVENFSADAPSAFPYILGYDPYVPPAILLGHSELDPSNAKLPFSNTGDYKPSLNKGDFVAMKPTGSLKSSATFRKNSGADKLNDHLASSADDFVKSFANEREATNNDPLSLAEFANNNFARNLKKVLKSSDGKVKRTSVIDQSPFKVSHRFSETNLGLPKLSYDIDTGNIYEENSKTWFRLVPL